MSAGNVSGMKIAHWTTIYPLPGAEHLGHAVKELVEQLRRCAPAHQHDVYLFMSYFWSRALRRYDSRYRAQALALRARPDPGLHLRPMLQFPKRLLERWTDPLWQGHLLPQQARKIEGDLIHVHLCRNLAYGAVVTGKQRGVPVVLTIRREMNLAHLPPWSARRLLAALRQADAVISPSARVDPRRPSGWRPPGCRPGGAGHSQRDRCHF